jgi:hypothetical protein
LLPADITMQKIGAPRPGIMLAWTATILLLVVCFACFLHFAWGAIRFAFEMDYTEGEIWRQANAIPGPRAYGDINAYPWIAFEYPPLFYIVAKGVAVVTGSFLSAGRLVSVAATIVSSGLIFSLVLMGARLGGTPADGMIAGPVAALMALTIVPIIAFATLVHVDNLALMFSLAGVALAAAALRRPPLLYCAVLAFVAATFTKQTCIAGPLAVLLVWGVRDPRLTARAFGAGLALGLVCTAWLEAATGGGFLRHILGYNINVWRLHNLLVLTGNVVRDCSTVLVLALVAVTMCWALLAERAALRGPADALRRMRDDAEIAFLVLITAYSAFSFGVCLLAGKNGASVNYFVELLYACCVWLGLLVLLHLRGAAAILARPWPQRLAFTLSLPALLAWQVIDMPRIFLANETMLYGPAILRDETTLLEAVRATDKPVLSDDIALVLLAGKDAPIEPFIFAELAAAGKWDEEKLLAMLRARSFGAVITYRDPGDVTFDVRFRPRTEAAILQFYPKVTRYGEFRLRMP